MHALAGSLAEWALVLILLLVGSEVQAGVDRSIGGQAYDIWQVDSDQEQNAVTTVIQSHEGYLWLGTYHGLVRFDGVRFTVFDSDNSPALPNGLITSLYEDGHGVLWIGHETGQLTRLTEHGFEPVPLADKWPAGSIESIAGDEHEDLWLLNDAGILFRLRDNYLVPVPGGASATRKVQLVHSAGGRLWLVSNGGVYTVERGQVVPFRFGAVPLDIFVERVLPARDGGLWVLGNQRLRKWRAGRWTLDLDLGARQPGSIGVLLETTSGNVLAGTLREGLFLLRPDGASEHFTRSDGLSHNWVRALCEDHEGNIWIGTSAGFDSLRPRKVEMLNPPDEWRGCGVLSLALESDGAAWIGTEGAGLYRFDRGSWAEFGETNGVSNPYVWSVLRTRQGQLYAGTYGGGLLAKSGDRFESIPALRQLTAPVQALYQGRHGELWIGTTAGLYRYENGALNPFAMKDKLVSPDVRAITETADGALWFGMSGGGLGRWKNGVLRQFRKSDGLGSDVVVCLYSEPDAGLWIGTPDHGLTRWREGKFSRITTAQGLPSSIITHLLDDGAGYLWIGSHRGILRASLADLDRCADGLIPSVHFLSYGRGEGLATQTCSGGFQPGAGRAADGRLWFPTPKGVAIVDPSNVTTNAEPPPVVIERLLVDGEPIAGVWPRSSSAGTIPIPAGRHRFDINYTGLSFMAPQKVRFRYKLEGLETDWRDVGSERFAEYSYLPPGDYRFQVIAANNDGIWNESGASLPFRVLPFFWQTWWFESLALTGSAGLIGAGALWASRRRVRLKLDQLERQRALERERARIARDIHDDLGASLTRITMLSQSVRAEVGQLPETAEEVDRIYSTARELTRAMDEIVWAVNPKHDTLDSLVTYLGRFAQQFLSAASIRCRLDVPVNLPAWALTAEVRHNVFLAFKEGLHNVLKHAGATEVRVSLEVQPHAFVIVIADNGCGFDTDTLKSRAEAPTDVARVAPGNGLQNMKKRLEEARGRCEWETAPGEGTRVRLVVSVGGAV